MLVAFSRRSRKLISWKRPLASKNGQNELAELQMDCLLRLQHNEHIFLWTHFWLHGGQEYPSLSESAIMVLIQFPTFYLCKLAFFSLTYIKNKLRQRLWIQQEFHVAQSTIPLVLRDLVCVPLNWPAKRANTRHYVQIQVLCNTICWRPILVIFCSYCRPT